MLDSYVRQRGDLSLLQAVYKMSYKPATILQDDVPQMQKKGRIQEGMDADIVVFDINTVENRAGYQDPTLTPIGINNVLVDGGELIVDAAPGRAIRREVSK